MNYKREIKDHLEEILNTEAEVETPKDKGLADYAFPCFKLSRVMHKNPSEIADELKEKIDLPFLERVESVNGYLNFFIKREHRAKSVLSAIDEGYGKSNEGRGKQIIIDYSSINIAKPFHIGHLSTTAIGHSLYRIYKYLGYDCYSINYLGDYGTQFGKMIVAFKKWGNKETVDNEGIREMYRLYVKYHKEAEENPELDEEAREWFLKIENKDEEALSIFEWMKERTLLDVAKIYKDLDITFDSYNGESFYNDKMQPVIDELKAKNLLKESKGAFVVDLEEYNMPPCLILKQDGATLYATRDIASALYRANEIGFYKSLYVVAYQQSLHFKQVFKVLELMGYEWAKDCVHVEFGMTSMEEGTMSTRKGKAIFLEDVLNKAVEKTLETINEKNPTLENKEQVAKDVGIGAVVYSAVAKDRINDITFSYDKVLSFEGETGPYIQYTHARCCSVLKKAEKIEKDIDFSLLKSDAETDVIKLLEGFPAAIHSAAREYQPCHVSRHLISLCSAFNRFYFDNRIISEDKDLTAARLLLTEKVRDVIAAGLYLIGIKAPEAM
ncbi:MAG: arginine--tRNA ligase [Clostridia bacterium]|nr:arginine--tRNA ligase [Clostridia bacterium]